ncbi:putative glycosyl transferase [compost metagenome]
MTILLINHYAGGPPFGMEHRPFYMAREWVRQGHDVTILAATQSHLRTRNPDAGDLTLEGIRYRFLPTPSYQGNGLGRVRNMLAFVGGAYKEAARLAAELKPDAVIASSTYPLDIYPARRIARLAKRHGAKGRVIFEVHDLWPLSPMELGNIPAWHPFIMGMQKAENDAYRAADRVVSMLPKAEAHMREHGMAPEKFAYLPNGIDVQEWEASADPLPELHREVLERLRAQGRFIVGYAGSHGLANAMHHLIDAAPKLAGQPVTLLLVGQGPEKDALQSRAQGMDNVVFLPPLPKGAVPALLDATDALYLGWNRVPLYRFGISPNKLMDYMMAAKPIIHSVEAGNDPVAESACGFSVPPEDPEAIASAITRLMAIDPAERAAMGASGRAFVKAHHDYRVLAQRFLEVMEA